MALNCTSAILFNWSAQSDYDGAYAGTYTGDDNGYWVAVADSTGTSAFLAWSTANDRGDAGTMASDNYGNSSFIGVCHPAGYVFGLGENNGEAFAFFGQISGADINGEWIGEDGSSGALSTGACTTGGGSSSGGGSSGPCFISLMFT